MICEWFNSTTLDLQTFVSSNREFEKFPINKNYKNVLTDFKKSDNDITFNLFNNYDNNDELISSHKYKINFTNEQHKILVGYFKECKKIYDLCVDIWKEYPEMTDNWQIVKDVIFKFLYRTENINPNIINISIINELKRLNDVYKTETNKYKDEIEKLKKEAKDKYDSEMKDYKEKLKLNKHAIVKVKLVKPKKLKIKLEKLKKPPKPRGETIKKPAPDESLKYEIIEFCKNLSNARKTNEKFEMKYKNVDNTQTISISKRNISDEGIFVNSLKKLNCYNYKEVLKKYKINKDCKLQYDKILNTYYIIISFENTYINIPNRKEVVALDPGEKTFLTFFSNQEYGKLGDNMRVRITKLERKIRKYQSILAKNKNKKGKTINNKKKLKKIVRRLYLKIKGYVNEVHKKAAKYLCENYKNILLPEFKTKPMISKKRVEQEREKINKMKNAEEAEKLRKELKKKVRMSREVKFVLSQQSHYRFKEYLKATAKRYKTNVYDVDESFTSQCCSECGILSSEYDYRTKRCKCGVKQDRDINGSRNILLKCVGSMPGVKARLATLKCHKTV